MLDLDDYETEYLSHREKKVKGYQAVYSANLMNLSNLKPLEYIIFEHNIFCEFTFIIIKQLIESSLIGIFKL